MMAYTDSATVIMQQHKYENNKKFKEDNYCLS